MGYGFLDIATTPSVKDARVANGVGDLYEHFKGHREFGELAAQEQEFIGARDSFYMATVSESGWPYMQHRGGPPGFVRVLDGKTLACADFRGNRQYISVGNLAANDRACLFFMDYPHRARLKMYVTVEARSALDEPALMAAIAVPGYKARVERALVFHLQAFDWNCPQHITPRFTPAEWAQRQAAEETR